jgi:hypothetical protein
LGSREALPAAAAPVLAALLIVGGHVGHVLLAQAVGDAAHGGVLAIALLVRSQRRCDVLRALARDLRHLVDFREGGLVALDAVAADAHRDLRFTGLGVTLDSWARTEKAVTEATATANTVVNNLFILRAQSIKFDKYQTEIISTRSPAGVAFSTTPEPHEIPRYPRTTSPPRI